MYQPNFAAKLPCLEIVHPQPAAKTAGGCILTAIAAQKVALAGELQSGKARRQSSNQNRFKNMPESRHAQGLTAMNTPLESTT